MKKSILSLFFLSLFFQSWAQQMPIEFEDTQERFTGFSGTSFSFDTDPTDPANAVGRFQNSGGAAFEGSFLDLTRIIDLSTDKIINMRVYPTDNAAHTVLLKLERGTDVDVEVPQGIPAGNQNTWVDLSFDFGTAIESGTNTVFNANGSYNRVTIFLDPNFNTAGVFLIDDIDDGTTPVDENMIDVVYDELVWSDEFDTTGGVRTPINPTNWFHQTQLPDGGSWFNGEVQHYTDRMENSYMENGFLHIVAKRETFTDQGETKNFTSARLNSKFAFTYGRIDVRAKLPFGDGTWPAIWTLGKNINEAGGFWQPRFGTVNWPFCGEIDVMEHGLGSTNHVSSALHTPSSSGATVNFRERILTDVANTFYVYSVNWSPNQITFLIDDVPFYTYSPTPRDQNTYPFTADQYILLNVAMGGISGAIDPNFQQSDMVIDYVRVFQESTAGIDDEFETSIKLYPNPAEDRVNIKSNIPLDEVSIFDLLGQQVYQSTQVESTVDISGFKSGIYIVKIKSGDRSLSRKLIVE
ncbi:MAG: family 16 glycosylhydrolase [Nonlabens sp.]